MSTPQSDTETAATRTTILSLPIELIVEVLKSCSVETLLHFERTCKTLHQICQSRPVWKTCMRQLDIEHAPSIDPFKPIETIPTQDIRNKVINAIRRSHSWRFPGPSHPLHMHVTDLPINRSPDDQPVIVEPRLLPGGREVIILNCGRIELWSLVTKEKIWELKSPIGRFSCAGFDFDVIESGNVVIIAILFEDFETTAMSPLRIYRIDLRTKNDETILERTLPPVFLFRMMLRGNYFVACIPRTFQTIVINWKAGEGLLLDFVDSVGGKIEPRSTVLAHSCLVSFATLVETGFSVIQLPISALAGYWSSSMDHSSWTCVTICPQRDACTILPLPYPGQEESVINRNEGFGPWILAHRVFKPVWKAYGEGKEDDLPTEIFIAAYDCGPGGQTPTRLVSFRLQLSPPPSSPLGPESESREGIEGKSEWKLKLITSACAQASQLPWNSRSLSNTGRMFSLRSKLRCFSLFTETSQPLTDISLAKNIVPYAEDIEPVISAVEPWSGAIVIGMPSVVKIVTFE